MIVKDSVTLQYARDLALTAANVAHEAQPYPQESPVFKGLADLSNAFSSASLRLLEASIAPIAPAPEVPQIPSTPIIPVEPELPPAEPEELEPDPVEEDPEPGQLPNQEETPVVS